jgi:hypothetical protein
MSSAQSCRESRYAFCNDTRSWGMVHSMRIWVRGEELIPSGATTRLRMETREGSGTSGFSGIVGDAECAENEDGAMGPIVKQVVALDSIKIARNSGIPHSFFYRNKRQTSNPRGCDIDCFPFNLNKRIFRVFDAMGRLGRLHSERLMAQWKAR